MSEIFITIALVCLVFSALWGLARRARRGCYPADTTKYSPSRAERVSLHAPPISMDVALIDPRKAYWHYESRPPAQPRLDAALKQALRSMSDESLRAFSPEAGDTQARRMRKLELDRRSRNKRRHARAARKSFESIQNGCKDSILSKAERDSLMPQGWDANGSPT